MLFFIANIICLSSDFMVLYLGYIVLVIFLFVYIYLLDYFLGSSLTIVLSYLWFRCSNPWHEGGLGAWGMIC